MNRRERRKAGYVANNAPLEITMGLSGEQVVIQFSTQVHWIGMDLEHAEEFLENVKTNVDKLKVQALNAERSH